MVLDMNIEHSGIDEEFLDNLAELKNYSIK